MSFQQFSLHPQVLAGVSSVGYTTPTPIQQQAIPVAMEGRDVMGLAQTGTGKTAAFALPILHHLASSPPKKGVRCLVIAPTRELAEQIHQAFVDLGKHLRIKSIAIYGGVSKGPQLAGIRRGAQVVIACPGRLLDHVDQKDIDLSGVEILVLDEADTMCDMGFLPDVRRILARVPEKRQTLFFSATMPNEIRSLAVSILKDPELVQIGAIAPAKTVSHAFYPVPEKLKKTLLLALLEQTPTGRALIFTRTKHRARSLALELAKKSFRVAALQGNMSQSARQRAMDGFRAGQFDILVATDIAAHGIDVPEISHVINFDFPNTSDTYTHRIGRTGRAEQTGEAFTLACAEDTSMVREVEKELGVMIERRRLPGFNYGDFTPEDQFPEVRSGQHRAARSSNGAGQRQNAGTRRPTGGQSKYRGNGSSNNGRRTEQTVEGPPRSDSSDRQRAEQPAARTTQSGSSNGRSAGQPADRTPQPGVSNGRSAGQPADRTARPGVSNGRRSGPLLGRTPQPESSDGRRVGQLLGRTPRTGSPGGQSMGQLLGKTSRNPSPDGIARSPKRGAPSSRSRPAQPGKPRGRSPARR
ncbi:MAG: DEAD/DEAH box helicase [Dehalococcoidia bacterium]